MPDYQPIYNVSSPKKRYDTPQQFEHLKRQLPHAIECPLPDMDPRYRHTVWAKCRGDDPRAYSVMCQAFPLDARYYQFSIGHCDNDDLCLDLPPAGSVCLPAASALTIRKAQKDYDTAKYTSHVVTTGAAHANFALVLRGQDDDQTVFQSSEISLVPRDKNNNNLQNAITCQECSELRFNDFPKNTENFGMNIILPHAGDIARLQTYGWYG
ncbi:hypothetical protein EV356DRAFT_515591 [Viridothelium virens]|uniref:Uncharacterized protein n=1 Tax=Viridothelium virens TaxID=1048519 RepID=A0A6A6HNK3_VIRVR|nr:hypothetical protein EV356DRAFT_515591 [Viridothelium virens]